MGRWFNADREPISSASWLDTHARPFTVARHAHGEIEVWTVMVGVQMTYDGLRVAGSPYCTAVWNSGGLCVRRWSTTRRAALVTHGREVARAVGWDRPHLWLGLSLSPLWQRNPAAIRQQQVPGSIPAATETNAGGGFGAPKSNT